MPANTNSEFDVAAIARSIGCDFSSAAGSTHEYNPSRACQTGAHQFNIVRHAFRISIADSGTGMTQSQENDLKSVGIVGMKERITRLGGECNIFSEPGKGTRLDIVIPTSND